MKHLMIIALITSFVSLSAFADSSNTSAQSEPVVLGQSETDCPMMRGDKRGNPKADLMNAKQTTRVKTGTAKASNQ